MPQARVILCWLLLGVLLCGEVLGQAPNPGVREVQQKVQRREYAQAVAQADELLAGPGLSANDRATLLKAAATASGAARDSAAAIAYWERIVTEPDIPNLAKIDALRQIAEHQIADEAGKDLRDMDLSPAMATLSRALRLPDLIDRDQAVARLNLGDLCGRRDQWDDADAQYAAAAALDLDDKTRARVIRAQAQVLAARGEIGRALAMCRERDIDLLEFCRSEGLVAQLHEECLRVLHDATQPDPQRWRAFVQLPDLRDALPDIASLAQVCRRHLPALLEADPNRALQLLTVFKRVEVDLHAPFVAWLSPMLLSAPRLKEADRQQVRVALVDAQAITGGPAAAVEQARQAANDDAMTPSNRLWAQLVVQSLTPGGDVKSVIDSASALSAKEQSESLLAAARTALRAGDESAARSLHALQQARLAAAARARVVCRYVDRAPADIGEWLASPLLQEAPSPASLSRPYGDNLAQLVETDAAMTGRDAADQAAQLPDDARTDLHLVCDAMGLHLFLLARDSQVEQVVTGTQRGGGFEMYLAPGERQPYYTLLGKLPTGEFSPQQFVTSYPNTTFRALSEQDGTFRQQVRAVEGGFAVYLFFSWQAFHDKLPRSGESWPFEAIRWTRHGGFSFGGSRSVHNRTSWGEVAFEGLRDTHLQLIRRQVVIAAAQRYRIARSITGALSHWLDPDLGDPAFHRTVLLPRVERFDALLEQISPRMTDAQVDQVYLEAVPIWMDMEAHLGALRRAWLEERLLREQTQ